MIFYPAIVHIAENLQQGQGQSHNANSMASDGM